MEPTELFVIREIGKLSTSGYWIRESGLISVDRRQQQEFVRDLY